MMPQVAGTPDLSLMQSPSLAESEIPEASVSPEDLYGPDLRELPEPLVNALRSAVREFQQQEKFNRRREVKRDSKLRFYEAGQQHLHWIDSRGYTILSPGGTVTIGNESMQCPTYIDSYNIFVRYFLIIQAVLTQSLPGIVWRPIDPENPEDLDRAKAAQDYAKLYDRRNDVKELMAQIVRMFGLSGRCVTWTRTEEDAQRFGFDSAGEPVRFQRTTIHGTLETKVPITCRTFDDKCLYITIYDDVDVLWAKDKWGWIKDKIKAGQSALGEDQYERWARLRSLNGNRTQQQVGDALSHLISVAHVFLRPAAFASQHFDEAYEGGTIRDKLLELFPQGVRTVWCGDTYAAAYPECMDDHIAIDFPMLGDSLSRPAFMELMAVVQDNFNDLCNWIREKIDTGAGSLWVNGSREQVDAVTAQKAAPNAIRPAKDFVIANQPLENAFYKEDDPQIPESLFKFLQLMKADLPEFLLAALPSLQGGDLTDNGTASGYAQATANAKGQLTLIWSRMKALFAKIRYQSALAAANDESATGMITVQGDKDGENISVNMDALKKGNFGCYPDDDPGFPETTLAKRAQLREWMNLAGASPAAMALFDNPDNIEQIAEILGFNDLTFIPAKARAKQLFEIEKMLGEDPIPPDTEGAQIQHAAESIQARQQGLPEMPFVPPQPQSTVPVEELDYHEYEFAKCQEWLSSKARRDQEKAGNLGGIQNIILHALAHRQYIQQSMLAQAALAAPVAAPPNGKGQPSPPAEKEPTPGTQAPLAA